MNPASRSVVRDRVDDNDDIHKVSPVGNGLKVIKRGNERDVNTFTNLMEDTGWYVASFHCPEGLSTEITLMPVPQE